MRRIPTLLVTFLAAVPYVVGHGFVMQLGIQGTIYNGNFPSATTSPSGIRQISTQNPVKGATNAFVNCGQNAQAAAQVLSANPGDNLTINWRTGDGGQWPHNTGPLLTYMASCVNTTCDQFDSQSARWFKIQQVAMKPNSNTVWVQQDLMNGGVATVALPPNIAPGQYLIRHEIIALHLAQSMGGAEFYPSCSQLKIGGNGTATPNANELVSLPGAYSDNDPGIYVPNVYDPGLKYQFPGPPVAALAAGNSTGSMPGSSTSSSSQPKSTQGQVSGVCHLKKQPSPHQSRHLSRIMRAFLRRSH